MTYTITIMGAVWHISAPTICQAIRMAHRITQEED